MELSAINLVFADVDLSSKLLLATQLAREKQQEKYLKERELALAKEKEVCNFNYILFFMHELNRI